MSTFLYSLVRRTKNVKVYSETTWMKSWKISWKTRFKATIRQLLINTDIHFWHVIFMTSTLQDENYGDYTYIFYFTTDKRFTILQRAYQESNSASANLNFQQIATFCEKGREYSSAPVTFPVVMLREKPLFIHEPELNIM